MSLEQVQSSVNASISELYDRYGLTVLLDALQLKCSYEASLRQDGWEEELSEIAEMLEDCTRKSRFVDRPMGINPSIETIRQSVAMRLTQPAYGRFSSI